MPTSNEIRHIALTLLADSGLHIAEHRNELIVTNPTDPERGLVCIALDDGYVSWERTVTDYWGHLEGLPPSQDPDDLPEEPPIPVSQVIKMLT